MDHKGAELIDRIIFANSLLRDFKREDDPVNTRLRNEKINDAAQQIEKT